ncbi:ABC transporter substrate-binding protein [Falsiroseomonas oryziterrae]|uniref:ABC transporter substrate-binding protein n=1 Tax=Falsiroseomonas oryziterrae TaxID=2911368 RepID=UPI001F4186F2|nr:ABC transporter substrate-binding protein [Roseomonas sp. NPKOSM-4]
MRRAARHAPRALALLLGATLAAAASAQPAPNLRIAVEADITSLDPHFHNLAPNKAVAAHFFEPLILQDEQQRLVPGLATSWRAIDERTWEFRLRQGVTWHDGSPFTAEDVAFTIARAPAVPNSPSSFGLYIRQIAETQVVDAHTIRFRTSTPFPLMPTYMSTFGIVSKRHGEGATTADYNSGRVMVGTGPYRFVSWTQGDRLVMERSQTHWDGVQPWGQVTTRFMRSPASRVAALLSGDVDIIDALPTGDIARVERDPRTAVSRALSNRNMYVFVDHLERSSPHVTDAQGRPLAQNPFRDLRVRQAVNIAVNREAIVTRVMDGAAEATGQLMPRNWFGWTPTLPPPAYDPEGARRLLAEAGFPNGFNLTIHCSNNRYVNDERICQALGQMLTRVGIRTQVQALPFATWIAAASRQDYSMLFGGWGIDTAEASSPLGSLLATFDRATGQGASNRSRYSNPEVDRLVAQGLATMDDEQRRQIFIRATEIAMRDVGLVPMHHQINLWGHRRGLVHAARADEWTLAMSVRPGN